MNDTLLEFPSDFPIKAMGHNRDDFRQLVIDLIRPHAPDLDPEQVTSRPSRGGRYLAVTVTVRATSRDQLDAIYRSLTDHRHVVMAL